ncbi:hypothetical protein ACWEV3_25180 [Saccharopolyspora sp. NPDC003752]
MSVTAIAVHGLLLHLAGRLPDDELAVLRTCLADGELSEIAEALVTACAADRLSFTEQESRVLAALATEHGFDPPPHRSGEPPQWRFSRPTSAVPAGDAGAVEAVGRVGGMRALWRSRRDSDGGTVHLGEAGPDADVVELTAEIQHRLTEAGQLPRVEVFPVGAELPAYHEAALAVAELVWPESPPQPRLARVFDGRDAAGNPFFRPDRGHVEPAVQQRLLAYLSAGPVVLGTDAVMRDVLDSGRSPAVGLNFRSDGTWIWNDAVCYYLERHRLAPDPELIAHVTAAPAMPAGLSRLELHCARNVLSTPETRAGQR